ncbi:unnamed protein product [Cuscuta epithymum]|uniref:Uncharacterized protein n=1 Tax=Cuscuta epithymum TaxID=186058 RepID=A0AAV0GH29_9ASTE|nr:unnamed protein product [Cuscuta epithymum]
MGWLARMAVGIDFPVLFARVVGAGGWFIDVAVARFQEALFKREVKVCVPDGVQDGNAAKDNWFFIQDTLLSAKGRNVCVEVVTVEFIGRVRLVRFIHVAGHVPEKQGWARSIGPIIQRRTVVQIQGGCRPPNNFF